MRRALWRPALWAAAIYGLLAVVFVSPALMPDKTLSPSDYLYTVAPWTDSRPDDVAPLGSNFELIDQSLQFEPFYRYTKERLPDAPLWNPHVMAGRPFLANGQSAVFSPFSTPAYVMPVSRALAWMAALKLFVAAFGAYLLARALRLRFAPALLAGLVYAFGLFFVAWLAWPLSSVWAWLPWLLAFTEMVVRRPGPLHASALAVIVALQFLGGHPESSFHVLFAALAFFVLRLIVLRRESPPEAQPLGRPIAAFAGALVGGGLLAAISLVPLGELILNSGELEERTEADPDKISASFLAMAFLPDYWGRPTETLLPVTGFINNRAFYAGALPLMLATAAPVLRHEPYPRRDRGLRARRGRRGDRRAADPPDRERAAGLLERAQRPADHLLPAGGRRAGGFHVRRPAGRRSAATGAMGGSDRRGARVRAARVAGGGGPRPRRRRLGDRDRVGFRHPAGRLGRDPAGRADRLADVRGAGGRSPRAAPARPNRPHGVRRRRRSRS